MGKVTHYIGQFIVIPLDEIFPGEGGVFTLGRNRCQVVANSIRVELLKDLLCRDTDPFRLGKLFTFEVEKLVRRNRRGQPEVTMPQQHRWPDHCMKDDVVLAEKVDDLHVFIGPPGSPFILLPPRPEHFTSEGDVTDRGIEPDV